MSEDADKIIFIFSFMQVHGLSESGGLACTDPGVASLVFPPKPSKAAAEQEGKDFSHCVTHGEWKQRNQSNFSARAEQIYPSENSTQASQVVRKDVTVRLLL